MEYALTKVYLDLETSEDFSHVVYFLLSKSFQNKYHLYPNPGYLDRLLSIACH